ncbi:MAG: hypothetical protein UE905_12495, partial [Segatella copri]|nr:hypothetical protein [Segatella copri]
SLFTHSSPLFTGMWLGACRLFLFYIAKVIKIFNIIVVLNKNYIFFDIDKWGCSKGRYRDWLWKNIHWLAN